MKQNFSMKKIATAVAFAAGVAGVQTASAEAILFPYVAASSTVTTVASVMYRGALPQLHYILWTKPVGTVNSAIQGCEEYNWMQNTSTNDIVTFDLSGHYGSATNGILFNDPGASAGAFASYNPAFPFSAMAPMSPTRGFMMVDNNTAATTVDSLLAGEAMMLEYAGGAAWGYQAYNARQAGATSPFDFSNTQEINGEVIRTPVAGETAPLELLPLGEWTNRIFVTPTTNSVVNAAYPGQHNGSINTQVGFTNGAGAAAYNRDEQPVSGQLNVNVTCVAGLDMTQMLSTGARTALANGGWGYVQTLAGTATNAQVASPGAIPVVNSDEAIIQKLQYSTAGQFNGEPVVGTVNSAVWLRNNTTNTGGAGSDGF